MRKTCHVLSVIAIAAAVLTPASTVGASSDMNDTIRQLAADAAELVAQEQALLAITTADQSTPDLEMISTRMKLTSVDTQGMAILKVLERLDVELTDAIRLALDPLPRAAVSGNRKPLLLPPSDVVYAAAIADLNRITTTSDTGIRSDEGSPGSSTGLLVVAALSLLALGGLALIGRKRRHPVADDLAAMAWSDGLTGLGNRRRLDRDLGVGGLPTAQTAVIMVDVDHFKLVNDSFGHQKGDEILRTIGAMLAKQIRYDDVVYRYGGEEFCILLPGSSAEEARTVADRIVDAAHQVRLPDGQRITVSVGVADAVAGDLHRAVESADLALYRAKDLGRDQAVTAEHVETTVRLSDTNA